MTRSLTSRWQLLMPSVESAASRHRSPSFSASAETQEVRRQRVRAVRPSGSLFLALSRSANLIPVAARPSPFVIPRGEEAPTV
jgi:hypothetical protein